MSKRTTKHAAKAAASASSAGSKRKSTAEVSSARPSSSADASAAPLQSDDDEEKQAAASSSSAPSATASASNPLLASVLESAAAAAPVAKRTRRAQHTVQTAEAHLRASPMLGLLGRDSGARQSLMQMLSVRDLASLLSSHRLWIAVVPASVGRGRVDISGDSLSSFGRCRWIQRSVQALRVTDASALEFEQFLRCMPQMTRLQSLVISHCSEAVSTQLLRDGFSAVAATLTELDLTLPDRTDSAPLGLWSALSVLTRLESLHAAWGQGIDLNGGVCSAEQVEALAQCKTLTDLRCGRWMPPVWIASQAEQTLTHNRLALLVQRRAENGAVPLRRLWLGDAPLIDPVGWRALSQCTDLESIESSWSSALTEADWARLAHFQHLRTLTIEGALTFVGPQRFPPLDFGRVLPPLVHCRALRSLTLDGSSEPLIVRTEHVTLIARIPSLESLSCHCLRIESLDPLTAAPALTQLQFGNCYGLDGGTINMRAMIPPMPLVDQLTISDCSSLQLSADQLRLCNAALLHRLPRLTDQRFFRDD